jgi:hypothetical protein
MQQRRPLRDGLKASERESTPISAKFEIEDGKLQTIGRHDQGQRLHRGVADPNTGTVAKAEKITDGEDLRATTPQKAAQVTARVTLLAAVETAIKAKVAWHDPSHSIPWTTRSPSRRQRFPSLARLPRGKLATAP